MMERPENVTVVILSEEEAKELSVRHALRCIVRDCRFLVRAFMHHGHRFQGTMSRGYVYKNFWWTRR